MGTKRKVFIPLAITIILLIAFVAAWACISQNDYVFKINGQKISMNEFKPYLILQKKSMELEAESSGESIMWDRTMVEDVPVIEVARDGAKQSLVDTIVKTQQAKGRNLSLTKEEKEQLRTYAEQYADELSEYGITVEEFAKMNEDVVLIDKLSVALYKEKDHSTHTHGKVDIESYEKGEEPNTTFNSRHILLLTEDLTTEAEIEAVKNKAENILSRVLNGEDFATLATQYSEDPGSKDNGGLYENTKIGNFVTEYEDAVFSIKTGEIYPELVKTSYGYHIIKNEGISNDFVRSKEAYSILMKEFNEEAEKWITDADVKVNEQRYNSAQ